MLRGTFLIGNLTFVLRLGLLKMCFSKNKESFLGIYFLFYFSFKNIKKNKW